jgi:hypothetical protein
VKQEDFVPEAKALAEALSKRLGSDGPRIAFEIYTASDNLFKWLNYLVESELTAQCDEFIDGLRASIVETVSCGAAGLLRPAIFAIRAQVDIVFSWLYFKDHPVEWARVERTGDGFVLKRECLDYLRQNVPSFEARFTKLLETKTRKEGDPYRLLSAHVHAQGLSVLPKHNKLRAIVGPLKSANELAPLQAEVTEYISDILLSCFGRKWASLPDAISEAARMRLGKEKVATVFG